MRDQVEIAYQGMLPEPLRRFVDETPGVRPVHLSPLVLELGDGYEAMDALWPAVVASGGAVRSVRVRLNGRVRGAATPLPGMGISAA